MRLSRRPDDPDQTFGRFTAGTIFIMLNRVDYWQCGYVIPKGGSDEIRQKGLDSLEILVRPHRFWATASVSLKNGIKLSC